MSSITIQPLAPVPGSAVDFGVEIDNVNLENLADDDFTTIRDMLYHHHLVLFRNQQSLSPKAQYELTRRFDPDAVTYGHGSKELYSTLKSIPHQPQVKVKGNGFLEAYQGLRNLQLEHPHHRAFHREPLPQDKDYEFTRFYRWHIDALWYDLNPPKVTTLMAVSVPKGHRQTILYDDGSGDKLDASLATTAFVSGQKMFDMLSPEDQEFVRTSKVEYAPHFTIWLDRARAFSNGLTMFSDGLELPEADLPPFDPSKILIFPMAWKNPVTNKLSLQIFPAAARKVHLADGSIIDDLEQVRSIIYRLQRPAISPQYVYAHDWIEGDLVLFNNHGLLHSVVGTLQPDEVRVFRQCNLAASTPPVGP